RGQDARARRAPRLREGEACILQVSEGRRRDERSAAQRDGQGAEAFARDTVGGARRRSARRPSLKRLLFFFLCACSASPIGGASEPIVNGTLDTTSTSV